MALDDLISRDWLQRRYRFCLARVRARRGATARGMDALIIAGLHREMAAINLLLKQTQRARRHLKRAGEGFLAEGLAHGLVLLALAGDTQVIDDPLARQIVDAAARAGSVGSAEGPPPRRSAFDLYSPHQWLATFEAAAIASSLNDAAAGPTLTVEILSRSLRPQASATTASGLPFGVMLDLFRIGPADDREASDAFTTAMAWRRQALRIARKDRYHWRLSLDPVALIDFDLLAVFTATGYPNAFLKRPVTGDEDAELEWLPAAMALQLRRGSDEFGQI